MSNNSGGPNQVGSGSTGSSSAGGDVNNIPPTDIPPGLSSSSNLSEEVKMSIRSISSEITIFEIKTPLPERSVPPCTAGSTTITTIGPVSSGGGGSSSMTSSGGSSSQHGSNSLSVRPPGSQQGGVVGSGGASLFTLNNKSIQLQPISSPLSRSQQIAAQSRGLSITASKQGPQQAQAAPQQQQQVPYQRINVNRRLQQSPSILLNQQHKVTLAPVRSSSNTAPHLHHKVPMRNLTKFNNNNSPNYGSQSHSNSHHQHHTHHTHHSHHSHHLHRHGQGQSGGGGNSNSGRFDPLMMLETRMVEEEGELNPVIENADVAAGPPLPPTLKRPSSFSSVNNTLQTHHFMKRAPVNRFTQLQQLQKMSLHPPRSLHPQIQSQQNRRKPVLIQLVELPPEDDTQVEGGGCSLDEKSEADDVESGISMTKPVVTVSSSPGRPSSFFNKAERVQSRTGGVTSVGRGRVSSRRRKRKRIYSSAKLSGISNSNIAKRPTASKAPPKVIVTPASTSTTSAVSSSIPTPPPTTMYRTRTMVKASLAAENQKALEAQIQTKPPRESEVTKLKTMKDIRSSVPSGVGRPWKRHNRKLSTSEQLEQTKKERYIDLESPRSILTQINPLHKMLTMDTFSTLPEVYRFQLLQMLPDVDREQSEDGSIKLRDSALSNEFFKKACQQWRQMLSDGELTPEQRYKNRLDAEKDRSKLDPWKVKHFEPIWGQKSSSLSPVKVNCPTTSPNSLTIPSKPSSYNLRRSPLRSPPCPLTDSKSSPLESSPLDVVDVGGANFEQKDKQIPPHRLFKSETMSLSKFEIEDDEEDDDDENDADFDANEESCSDGENQDEDQVMSSARTTGIVQRSAGSTQSQTQAQGGTLTRSRKRSGVESDPNQDKDSEMKKIKVAPPKLSPIEEVQNKLGDVSIKLIPSPKFLPPPDEKITKSSDTLFQDSTQSSAQSDPNISSSSVVKSAASTSSNVGGGRGMEENREITNKPSAQLQISPECDKQVHKALVANAEQNQIAKAEPNMPSIIVNTNPDLKITPSEKGVGQSHSVGFSIERSTPKPTPPSISITPTVGTRRLRSIHNAPKKDVAIEVNMPERERPPPRTQFQDISISIATSSTSTSSSSPSTSSVVSMPVGTGATLTLIPMSTINQPESKQQKHNMEQQQSRDTKPNPNVTGDNTNQSSNESKSCSMMIPPEIQSILPATLTVVPSSSDVPRLLPSVKVTAAGSSGLSSPTVRSSPSPLTLLISSNDSNSKAGTMTLSGGDVTIIPNHVRLTTVSTPTITLPSDLTPVPVLTTTTGPTGPTQQTTLTFVPVADITTCTSTKTASDLEQKNEDTKINREEVATVASSKPEKEAPTPSDGISCPEIKVESNPSSPGLKNKIETETVMVEEVKKETNLAAAALPTTEPTSLNVNEVESSSFKDAAIVLKKEDISPEMSTVKKIVPAPVISTPPTPGTVATSSSKSRINIRQQQPHPQTASIHSAQKQAAISQTVASTPPAASLPLVTKALGPLQLEQQSSSGSIIVSSRTAVPSSFSTATQPNVIIVSSASTDSPKPIMTPIPVVTLTNQSFLPGTPAISISQVSQSSPVVIQSHQSQQIIDSSSTASCPSSQESGYNKSQTQKSRPKPNNNKVCDEITTACNSISTITVTASSPTSFIPSPPPPSLNSASTTTTWTLSPKQASSSSSPPSTETSNNKVPRPISTSHPPGQINLERSYQICRAVIQNSPNRDQLQHQLVKPPPVPKLQQQQFRMIQSLGQVGGDAQMIQIQQRRSSTPNILSSCGTTTLQPMPIQLSGVGGGPHGKVILAHISNNPQSSVGSPTSQHQQITIAQAQQGGGGQNVPLIRPAQPGSPIIVRTTPGGQNPQFLQNASSTTTVITPQQLAMLIQQQHQQASAPSTSSSSHHHNHFQQQHNIRPASPSSQQTLQLPTFINVNQLNRPVAVSVSQPSRPNSASSVVITNPNSYNSNQSLANSHKLLTSSTTIPQNHFLRQSYVPVSSQSSSAPPLRHQLIHIQKQQFVTSSNPSSPGGCSTGTSYPVRAQIVTSNGETITIHRASAPPANSNGPTVRVSTPRPLNYNYNNGQVVVGQGSQQPGQQIQIQGSNKRLGQNFITINRVGSPGVVSSGQQQQIQLISSQRASPGPVVGVAKQGSSQPVSLGISGNGVQKPGQGGGIRLISLEQGSNNNSLSSSGNISDLGELLESSLGGTPINSISNLAEFITNQLAASNIRSISPLTLDQNLVKLPNNGEASSPQQQITSCTRTNAQAQQGGIMIISSMANNNSTSSSTTSSTNAAVNSNVISSSSSIGGRSSAGVNQALSDFFNNSATPTTTEIIMDFQDALGSDSPYSLISESDSHAIAEIIDLHPSHREIVVTSSAPSGSYVMSNTSSSSEYPNKRTWPVNHQGQNLIPVSHGQSLVQGTQQRQISSGTVSLKPNPSGNLSFSCNSQSPHHNATGNAASYTLTSSSPSTLLTSSSNRNRITTSSSSSSPFILSSGGGHNTSLLQNAVGATGGVGGNQIQQQTPRLMNSGNNTLSMMPIQGTVDSSGRQQQCQQYIIVQTTGSNGLPTNLAVPASIVISPQGQLIFNNDQQLQKTPPRASSAPPPLQSGGQIIINSPHQQSNMNSGAMDESNLHISQNQHHRVISVSSSNGGGNGINSSSPKTMSIPTLEIQEGGGVRVVYSGQSSVQHLGASAQQRSFTLSQNRASHISSTTTAASSPQSGQFPMSEGIGAHSLQQQGSTNLSFSNNLNSLNLLSGNHQNIVQLQSSQAPTIVHQQTINQVVTSAISINNNNNRQITSSTWNNNGSASRGHGQGQLINVNLNGIAPGSTARIITTTQPGQHPVISIPDTTQVLAGSGTNLEGCGGDATGLLGGAEFDIFRAIEGMNVKVNGGNNTGSGNMLLDTGGGLAHAVNTSSNEHQLHNNTSSEFNGAAGEEVGQLILDSGGNCVCDLRAMIMCRKCGAFCHDDCIAGDGSDLCLTCLIR